MSGYNAEYSAPRETELEDLPATLEPIVLNPEPELVKTYNVWEFPTECYSATFEPMTVEQGEIALSKGEWDVTRLLATVRHQSWMLRRDISADDPRLTHIWESASEIADRRGYCDVFDSIMDEIGTGYTREMEYCVTVSETIKYDVHVTAPRNATQSDIEELIQYETLSDHTEIERDWEVDNYESAE